MRNILAQFRRDKNGSTALTLSIALVPLLTGVGAAVDYARAWRVESQLQNAADAAALAAASITAYQREKGVTSEALARQLFAASFIESPFNITYSETGGVHRVLVTAQFPTALMNVVGITNLELSARAAAVSDTSLQPACFMAMHPTRKHTLELKGSVSVIAPDCHIYGNSNDEDDVVDPHTPHNFLTGKSVQAVGYGHHYIQNVKPPLEYAPRKLDDPLAAMAIPVDTACAHSRRRISGAEVTLSPGVYCGGLEISRGSKVTLQAGAYFIEGGNFTVTSSTVTGAGVSIVLSGTRAAIDWSNSTIRLAAPKTGSLASIVVTGTRFPASHRMEDSTIDLHGVVYLPQGAFDWTNNGTPAITAKWTAWIIDGVTWDGNGVIRINFDPAGSDIPFPGALKTVVPRPVGARNPRLTAY